jgi:hypothetical protein
MLSENHQRQPVPRRLMGSADEARSDLRHHLPFANGQERILLLQLGKVCGFLAPVLVLSEGNRNSIKQILIPYRFGEEIDCAQLHAPHAHGNVAKAGHQNNGEADVDACQMLLELQAAGARQPDIEHQTRRSIRQFDLEKIRGRFIEGDLIVHRPEQVSEGLTNRPVVVDDVNKERHRQWLPGV